MFSLRRLLVATALLEIGSGLLTLFLPDVAVRWLFGVADSSPQTLATGRLYGAALLAIGVACWCARNAQIEAGARAVLCGMLMYNVGASCVLPFVAALQGLTGILLWPAAVLHAGLTLWCVRILREGARPG